MSRLGESLETVNRWGGGVGVSSGAVGEGNDLIMIIFVGAKNIQTGAAVSSNLWGSPLKTLIGSSHEFQNDGHRASVQGMAQSRNNGVLWGLHSRSRDLSTS